MNFQIIAKIKLWLAVFTVAVTIGSLSIATISSAATYDFSYSGRLVDREGRPLAGPVALKISFFHSETTRSSVLDITQGIDNVTLRDGVFQVVLSVDASDFNRVFSSVSQAVYVEVTDLTNAPSSPYGRQQLTILPYAGKIPVNSSQFSWNSIGELQLQSSGADLTSPGVIGGTTPAAATFTAVTAKAPTAASTAVTVQGAAGQTGDLTEWKNSAGSTLSAVDASGVLKFAGGSYSVGIKGPAVATSNLTYTLPASATAGAFLTTDATGNLSWAATGGSVAATGVTGLTTGSVPFANGTGLTEDATNLFWDNTNDRLGIGTSTPGVTLDVNGNMRIANLRTYALTRTLSTTADDTILLGALTFTSKSAIVTMKVAMSGFGAAKSYFLPLTNDQTSGAWKEVMPLTSSKEGTDNFAIDVNVATTTATFRLRRVAGATAGTAYINLVHEGVMTDTFTAASTTGSSAAPGSYYNASLLTMTAGGITAGGPITLPADPTSALHAATKQYVDATVAAGVTASSAVTFTGKTIDADDNTISDISDANIKTTAAITDTKLATISTAGKVSGAAITSGTIAGTTAVSTSGDIATTGKVGIGAAAGTAKLEVTGSGATSATSALNVMNSTPTSLLYVRNDGNVGIGSTAPGAALDIVPNAANTSVLKTTGYSLDGSNTQSLFDLAGTWNTTGAPTAIKLNLTDTASNASSLFLDLQTGGTSRFSVRKNGDLYFGTALSLSATGGWTTLSSGVNGAQVGGQIWSPSNRAAVGIGTSFWSPTEQLEVGGNLRAGMAPSTLTTISGAHTTSVTTITVTSTTGYPSFGTILVSGEAINYINKTTTTFTGCTRGVLGTTAVAFAGGETVNNYMFTLASSSTTPRMVVTGSGNVGIGTTAPTAPLHVVNTANTSGYKEGLRIKGGGGSTYSSGPYISFTPYWDGTSYATWSAGDIGAQITAAGTGNWGGDLILRTNSGASATDLSEKVRITNSGNVGIGTTSPSEKLHVNGKIRVDTLAAAAATAVCIDGSNTLASCSSSIRYKDHVEHLNLGLDAVLKMRPVTFKWKNRDEFDLGFIAEEIHEISPLLNNYRDGQIEGVKYGQVTAVLVKAVQELKAFVDTMFGAQSREIAELKAEKNREIAQLKAEKDVEVAQLDEQVAQLKAVICEMKPESAICSK